MVERSSETSLPFLRTLREGGALPWSEGGDHEGRRARLPAPRLRDALEPRTAERRPAECRCAVAASRLRQLVRLLGWRLPVMKHLMRRMSLLLWLLARLWRRLLVLGAGQAAFSNSRLHGLLVVLLLLVVLMLGAW